MDLKFGALFVPNDFQGLVERAKVAEDLGFDLVGLGDSQSLFREVYVSLAVVAQATSRVRLGPMVSNLHTRHLALTASAIASIDDLSGGRAVLGLGTGDSSLLNIGAKPATVAATRRAVETLHELFQGKMVPTETGTMHARWISRPVPVWLAAEGPRMLEMTGAVADGVLIGTGLTPEIIRDSLDRIRAGAASAGRAPEEVETWVFAKSNVAGSWEEAVHDNKMALAASAHHAFRFTLEGKLIPDELKPQIEKLMGGYDTHQHEQHGPTINAQLPDELGLTEYLADRFGVFGTPAQCIQKVEQIAEAGVTNILFTVLGTDPVAAVRRLGEGVVAHFKR
ncbi:MAG TPA: LLM class flavin-dependent oxidoreductase [Dehalococcoidia bacterium]|nr:LLM class flavin-dependent oxidoreductase [Dehalococcoidia bacterium]